MNRLRCICADRRHFKNLHTRFLVDLENSTERWSRLILEDGEVRELIYFTLFTMLTPLPTTGGMLSSFVRPRHPESTSLRFSIGISIYSQIDNLIPVSATVHRREGEKNMLPKSQSRHLIDDET